MEGHMMSSSPEEFSVQGAHILPIITQSIFIDQAIPSDPFDHRSLEVT